MMLTNSYNESRAQYEKNRNVSDPSEAQRLIDDALEAARFIGGNIVKGVVNPDTGELISVAVVLATLHMAHCRRLDRRNWPQCLLAALSLTIPARHAHR